MPEINATEASRSFSRILDTVEHVGTSYVIVRHGTPVAQLTPVVRCTGSRLKTLLGDHPRDADWRRDLATVRDLLEDEPRWT